MQNSNYTRITEALGSYKDHASTMEDLISTLCDDEKLKLSEIQTICEDELGGAFDEDDFLSSALSFASSESPVATSFQD